MFKQFFLWILIISLIVFRYFSEKPVYKDGDRLKITTTVYADPVIYETSQYLKIAGIKVYLPKFPEIAYGDKVTIEGTIQDGKLQDAKIISRTSGAAIPLFRSKLIDFYKNALPQPESGLIGGIVLGAKEGLDADFYDMTKVAGVAHVVVASGTNITFVISFLAAASFIFLKRKWAIPVIAAGIVFYLFLSGFDAPLVRAAVMAGIVFLGQGLGRVVSAGRIFFLTAGLMLIYNPEWIVDLGFLLSFASTGSILLFQKRIRSRLRLLPGFIREDLSVTLSAQIGVAPILFVTFGTISIWSPVTNLLVLWTVPFLMIIGWVGGVAGLIFAPFGKLILFLGYPLLWWFIHAVRFFS